MQKMLQDKEGGRSPETMQYRLTLTALKAQDPESFDAAIHYLTKVLIPFKHSVKNAEREKEAAEIIRTEIAKVL